MRNRFLAHPLVRLYRYARHYRRRVTLAALCSIANKLFDLAPPLLIGAAVDVVVSQEESVLATWGLVDVRLQLIVLAILTIFVWAMESLFQYLYDVLWRNLAQSLEHDLRVDAYGHVQDLEMAYFEERSTGGLMAILNDDVNQLERFLDGGANDLLQVTTTVIAVGAIFFTLAPAVAWWAFVPMPIVIWGALTFQRRIGPRYAAVREQVGALNGLLANNLSGLATIKSFTAEAYEAARVRSESDRYRETNRRAIALSAAFSPLIRMVIVVGFTITLLYGGFLALAGELNVGAYSVLVYLTQRLLWPLTRLGVTFDLYQRALASTSRILNLLDTEPQIQDGRLPLPTADVRGALTFDGVRFAYGQEATPVIRTLSLHIPAGDTVAFVGLTGAGKTTLIKLLLRFYDVQQGCILLDDRDIRTLQLADLRRAIGLVSQDVFLFHGTVRENIAYGSFDATEDEIVAAARLAEADDFIRRLPQGYDTVVGERGQKLSGGQRQRLSIARAILKEPRILILDEATSSVDNETEAAIQRSLAHIAVGRTTILIAHRLSTVRHSDTIYVLDQGRVVEKGRHDDLLAREGLYARLWQVQTGALWARPQRVAPAPSGDGQGRRLGDEAVGNNGR